MSEETTKPTKEDAATEPVKPPAKKEAPAKAGKSKASPEEAYAKVLANADKRLGDKCPTVVKWCKTNLGADDFKAKYGGRNLPKG